uniref:GSFK dehydrogenase n=1 Tax=Malurus cyaneus samueli TaxID=2593467 RepID=A0A8C5TPK6_9PASS
MGELCVRSVLVTGANRGIGLGFVQHFLRMPKPPQWIFATCRDPKGQRAQELQNLASKHPNLVIIALEVTDPASIKAAAAKVGEHLGGSGLNLLINNAGMVKPTMLENETLEAMTEIYTTNTIGPLLMGQAFLPLLKKAAQGSPGSGLSCSKAAIANISSIGGSITFPFGWEMVHAVSYRCSKVLSHLCFPCPVPVWVPLLSPFLSHHRLLPVSPQAALNMLTKCQSLGYREHGILCVTFHPGWVQTDLGAAAGQTPPLTVDESVQGMLKVLSSISEKDTGTFLDWEGKVIPW